MYKDFMVSESLVQRTGCQRTERERERGER